MKQLLIVNVHSFIDVITNSSTELFICDDAKTIDLVKKVLEEKWNAFKILYPEYISCGDVWNILEVYKITKERLNKENDNYGYYSDYGVKAKEGDIEIVGTSDNSIPYRFFDVIEDNFNATRYHLG